MSIQIMPLRKTYFVHTVEPSHIIQSLNIVFLQRNMEHIAILYFVSCAFSIQVFIFRDFNSDKLEPMDDFVSVRFILVFQYRIKFSTETFIKFVCI